jgi:hypothetical protein
MSEASPENSERGAACPRAESVAGYVLGELAGDELAGFEKHLATCDACRRAAADFRAVIARMREVGPEPLARDLTPAILAKVDEMERRRGRRVLTLPRIAAVAASFVAALAAALVGRRMSLQEEAPVVVELPVADAPAGDDAPVAAVPVATPTEVLRALDWLAASQEPDGSWDATRWEGQDTFTVGLSGLAVLAFVGAGETHRDGAHARTVERGLDYLVGCQVENGRLGPFLGAALYNHGIATVALLEVYARTREPGLREPIGRALDFMTTEQGADGGWGYLGGGRSNTSVTAWQIHALLLAASLDWPDASAAGARGLAWLEGIVGDDGLAGYTRPGDHPNGPETLTAMTALMLSVGSSEMDAAGPEGARAVRSLVRLTSAPAAGSTDYYRSYFLTHALRVAEATEHREVALSGTPEGEERPRPTDELRVALVERQLRAGPNSGSWSPSDRWGLTGGRVYSTAMAALSLEADRRADELVAWVRGVPR